MPGSGHIEGLRPAVCRFDGAQGSSVNARVPAGVGAFGEDERADRVDLAVHAQLGGSHVREDATGGFDAHARGLDTARAHAPHGTAVGRADLFQPGRAIEAKCERLGAAGTVGHEDRVDVVGGQRLHGRVVGVDHQGVGGLREGLRRRVGHRSLARTGAGARQSECAHGG